MSKPLAEMDEAELNAELQDAQRARELAEFQDGWEAYTRAVGLAMQRIYAVRAEFHWRAEAAKAEIDQLRDAGDDAVSEGG